MNEWMISLVILVIAFLYSSVGHGGASGYLALLTTLHFLPEVMKPSALLLNLLVSSIAFVQFARAGFFRFALFWPFALTSIPMSYLGAGLHLEPSTYALLLAICLLVAVARLFGLFGKWHDEVRSMNIPLALAIGAVLGFLSGIIGIGGGILLSPILLLLRWCTAKESAAISALFIFVNSAAGMLRYANDTSWLSHQVAYWIAAAFLGAMAGSAIGARRFSNGRLKQVLGTVLLLASIKLLWPWIERLGA